MMKLAIFEWDYKADPPWEDITNQVSDFDKGPFFHTIHTGDDSFGVVAANMLLNSARAQQIFNNAKKKEA